MTTHPLDPLTPAELALAVSVARRERRLAEGVRFCCVDLLEPDKAELAAWRGGGRAPEREALLVLLDTAESAAYECVVALDDRRVVRWTPLGAMQPAVSADEFVEAAAAARTDQRYLAALARRGITGDAVDLVHIEPWTVGDFEAGPGRLVRCLSWLRAADDDPNPYARPIGRLVALVDLSSMTVVRVDDGDPLPVPGESGDYRDGGGSPYRDDQRALEITQPDGPSFTLDGRELRWQRWSMRVGFSNREGLVLHELAYEDGSEARSICHRASIAELVIPYGDPNPTVHFKNVFDIGEYGLGPLVNQLELGCDCVGEIRYLDSAFVDTKGNVVDLGNTICIHEEDYGILWKHRDDALDEARRRPVAPAGRLVRRDRRATTSTASSGTSTRTARSSSRAS